MFLVLHWLRLNQHGCALRRFHNTSHEEERYVGHLSVFFSPRSHLMSEAVDEEECGVDCL